MGTIFPLIQRAKYLGKNKTRYGIHTVEYYLRNSLRTLVKIYALYFNLGAMDNQNLAFTSMTRHVCAFMTLYLLQAIVQKLTPLLRYADMTHDLCVISRKPSEEKSLKGLLRISSNMI